MSKWRAVFVAGVRLALAAACGACDAMVPGAKFAADGNYGHHRDDSGERKRSTARREHTLTRLSTATCYLPLRPGMMVGIT